MKKFNILIALLLSTITVHTMAQENPLLGKFDTPHSTAPFSSIHNADYEPAIDASIASALAEVEQICANPEPPTFDNTIVALEGAGQQLDRVLNIFFNLLSANTDDEMMEISLRVSPKLSAYSTSIALNQRLWERIRTVWDSRDSLNLDPEEEMLLKKTYDAFADGGARLEGEDREKFKEIAAELSELTTRFGQNVLKELNTYEIILDEADLAGLPADVVTQARQEAADKGLGEDKFLFTLAQPTYMAFLKYSDRRDLREKFYRLYNARNTKGEYSNMDILRRIADLRRQEANLLGSPTYAAHSLKHTMAETPENVYDLLNRLRDAYMPALARELDELTQYAASLQPDGAAIEIMPWDYSYYSNKLRNAKYAYDEEELRPYFPLDRVIDGVFGLATRLYGLTFTPNPDIEVYHPDVTAYDVNDEDGNFIGVLYTDFYPRASKRPGAWMTGFKEQSHKPDGTNDRPHISIVMNFTKPGADKPSLLTPYEVETFLHEFGHALHGLLADTRFASLSGTSVYRDFVELPSQFNENYMTEKEFLDTFARNYQTDETIPTELVERLIRSSQFGAAYQCIRQLNFGYADMAWHTLTEEPQGDVADIETRAISDVMIFKPVEGMLFSPQFSHIFSGGYAAGYYSYKWAEVLDADAFAKFKENGIFDRKTADEFRKNILTQGGTQNPAKLYRQFRGQDPTIDALLIRDGIKKADEPKPLTQPN